MARQYCAQRLDNFEVGALGAAADVVCLARAAARQHGNGVIEISARGSLQVRGLTPVSAPLFGSYVTSLDIDLDEGVRMLSRLVGADRDKIAVGDRGTATFDGRNLPPAQIRRSRELSPRRSSGAPQFLKPKAEFARSCVPSLASSSHTPCNRPSPRLPEGPPWSR
jgi:hypothetical protein